MLKKYLMVVFLMFTFGVAQAAEPERAPAAQYSADMTAEQLETALTSEEDIEAAVEKAIQAGVDPVLVVESAIKVSPENMATTIKSAAVVAAPDDKQYDVYNAADKAVATKKAQSQSAQGGESSESSSSASPDSASSGGGRSASFSAAFTAPGGGGGFVSVGNNAVRATTGGGATAPTIIVDNPGYFAP